MICDHDGGPPTGMQNRRPHGQEDGFGTGLMLPLDDSRHLEW